jgi:hypothetical protein
VNLAQTVNPMFRTTDRHSWTDSNRDGLPQPNEIGLGTGFQGSVNTRIDPGLRRPYNWEYAASVQHEVMPKLALSVGYYRRQLRDLYGSRNVLVPESAYAAVTITNPLTNQPLTVFNQDPATRGRTDLVLANDAVLDTTYNGVEVQVTKRFDNNATLFGGFTAGRNRGWTTQTNTSIDLNNPNFAINAIGAVGFDSTYQSNIAGSYVLPYHVQVSGALRTATGQPLNRTLTVTRTQVANLTQVTQSVNLLPRGEVRLQRANLLDFRLSRIFSAGARRFEALADIYNVLNSNATTGEVQAVGSSLGRPDGIVDGRLLRLGVQIKF